MEFLHAMIRYCLIVGCLFVTSISIGYAQKAKWDKALSPRIANYDISVTLDTAAKTLTGKEVLTWRNDSPDVIEELHFHLYLNAYKNTESTFLRSGSRFGRLPEDELGWGWMDIISIEDENGRDLTAGMEFIHPTDDNENDQTVVRVPLRKSIGPRETAKFKIDFVSKLPRIIARTGFEGEHYYFVVQWFPKIGVYEEKGERGAKEGSWNCHQFIPTTEFYADFGVYDVEITLPQGYVVGASGVFQEERKNMNDTKTVSYRAEDVIDFAWTASPDFEEVKDKWNDVEIRLLIQPEHKGNANKYLQSTRNAFEYMSKYVGEYPYTTFTIVDPPIYGIGSSGMEYPTLITGLPAFTIHEGVRQVEMVTIHEFVHQYFMQMVASNEQEEVWLDEGFTTYYENRIADHYYGEKTSEVSVGGYNRGDGEVSRLNYTGMSNPRVAPCATPGWEFKVGGERNIMYHKTGLWMKTLERMVGIETMDKIMQTYFKRWKFKHPTGTDFIAVANEVVTREHGDKFGNNLNWFFDQVIYGTQVCDYKVRSISNRKQNDPIGMFENANGKKRWRDRRDEEGYEDKSADYRSRVLLERVGDLIVPLDVLVRFDNGDEVLETWDGKSRNHELIYERPEKIVSAQIDPEQKILMDIDLNNNSLTKEPGDEPILKWASKVLFWMQNALQSTFFFF